MNKNFLFLLLVTLFSACAKEDEPVRFYEIQDTTWNVVFVIGESTLPAKLIFTDGNLNFLGEDVNYMQYGNQVSWLYHDSVLCDAQLKKDFTCTGDVTMSRGNRKLGTFAGAMER